jgi:hypothetical protein
LKLTHHHYQRHLALLNVRVLSSNQRDCKERTCIRSNKKSSTFLPFNEMYNNYKSGTGKISPARRRTRCKT